jgi:hypothetical protein
MKKIFILLGLGVSFNLLGQEDLLDMLEQEQEPTTEYTEATFKATRLINGHTIETRDQGTLIFLISHRFGVVNGGAYEFFGLDQASIRLGLEYAITDRLFVGAGRSSFEKTYDGFVKYKMLRQSFGIKNVPITMTWLSTMSIKTLKDPTYNPGFSDRLAYVHQLMIARKFNSSFSLQVMPTFVHHNTIQPEDENNNQIALGVGGRIKLTNRVSLNLEYYHQFVRLNPDTYNSIAIGFDIETGGHVFQLHLTNSTSMIEKGFITETSNNFFDGDIHFGFNISRTFQLAR